MGEKMRIGTSGRAAGGEPRRPMPSIVAKSLDRASSAGRSTTWWTSRRRVSQSTGSKSP